MKSGASDSSIESMRKLRPMSHATIATVANAYVRPQFAARRAFSAASADFRRCVRYDSAMAAPAMTGLMNGRGRKPRKPSR